MPLWLDRQPLVLASKSDIRGKILAAAGLRFEIRPAPIDERAVEAAAGKPEAAQAARLLARAKAGAVAAAMPGRVVLGADQTLALGEERFGKPKERADAAKQLRRLRGKTHALHSALSLVRDGQTEVLQLGQPNSDAQLNPRGEAATVTAPMPDGSGETPSTSVQPVADTAVEPDEV